MNIIFLKSLAQKYKNYITVFFLVIILSYISYGEAMYFSFWKDDWIYLWGEKYNLGGYYLLGMGNEFIIRTGFFMPLFVSFFKWSTDPYVHQLFGLSLKIINSLVFYFFVLSFTEKRRTAVIGVLLFASTSLAFEVYTWHVPTGFMLLFTMLAFTFYNNFLKNMSKKSLIYAVVFFILAALTYLGRFIGSIFLLGLLNTVLLFNEKSTQKRAVLIGGIIICLLLIMGLKIIMPGFTGDPVEYLIDSLGSIPVFFGNVGNMLRVPYFKLYEEGGLASADILSYFLGYMGFVVGIISALIYFKTKTNMAYAVLVSIAWIYTMYLFNWLYGGGGVTTEVGSTHRYLALSTIGLLLLTSIFLSSLTRYFQVLFIIIIIILNINYTHYINGIDNQFRNNEKIESIYKQISAKVTPKINIIVVDNPGILRREIVMWAGPHPFTYYANIDNIENFPTLIHDFNIAVEFICAGDTEKATIATKYGFKDYQINRHAEITPETVTSWKLYDDGNLEDTTSQLGDKIKSCQQKTQ